MAIYDINTIQGDVNTSYGDEYLKQALANLGQRQGLKGDAIQTKTFKISDVIFDSANKIVPTYYIKGYYDATNDVITYTADDESTPLLVYTLSDTIEGVVLNNLYTLSSENVNLPGTYKDCKIIKNTSTNSYYFIGCGIDNEETTSIVVLEFGAYGIDLLDGLYFERAEADKIIMMHYNDASQREYTGVSLSNIYPTLKEYTSIDDILNLYVNNIVTLDDNPNNDSSIIEEEHNDNVLTVFKYISSVLIPEIKTLYNDSIYKIDGNGYLGLKRRIIYELIKRIYNEFNKIDSKTDTGITVYFDKDFYISYIANTNTDVIYLSYDISFRGRGINNAKIEPAFDYKNDTNLFLADITTEEDRYASYKFYINYIDDDKYVDSITIDQTAILPYIGKNDDKKDVWYINGEQTNINATGKDAGNPNIMFISYTKNESASENKSSVDIKILHTYTDENVTLEILNATLQTPSERVMQKFYYDLGSSVNVANSIDKNYEFEIALPDPNKLAARTGFETFVKNVLIFAIVDTKISTTIIDGKTLHTTISGQNGPSTYLTVFFHISKTTDNKYEWVPILNPLYSADTTTVSSSSVAPVLDLSAMTSLNTLMNYYVQVAFKPDVYYHRWVVFESTNETLKNTDTQATINTATKYPVIKVDTSTEYYGVESNNNLNFTPKFVAESSIIEDNGKINQINDTSVDNASFTINDDGTVSDAVCGVKVTNDNKDNIERTEWIPNAKLDQNAGINDSYPILDLREVFVNNQMLLNRLSIITTGEESNGDTKSYPIYHAYIGHRYNSGNTGIASLVIGSEPKVYNMQNSTTMGRDNSWQNFKTFNNLIFALPTVSEQDAKFEKNVLLEGKNGEKFDFTVNTKNTVFNTSAFNVSSPSIIIQQALDSNYLKFENNKISIISPNLELNNSAGIVNIKGTQISNTANTITLNGQNVSIDAEGTTRITTKAGFSITNTKNNNEQKISFNDNDITVKVNGSTIKLEDGTISLPANKRTSIVGGDPDNFIKYNPDSLEISSNDLKLKGNITTSGGNLVIDNETTINKPIVIKDKLTATGTTIELGSSSTKLTLNGSATEFNTGDTTFSGNVGVRGNVTATNVTVNGLLVTETSSVTSVLTYPNGSNWDYPYGDNYATDYVKKMFLFGLTTIDLNYVCNGKFEKPKTNEGDAQEYYNNSEFITVLPHTINTSRETNTRTFIPNYSYSDIKLNLTAFLNAYSKDSMFARYELTRPNAPEGTPELVTKISDVIIPLSNPSLYTIEPGAIGGGVNIPDEYRLKTFLLFIERFAFFANPTDDFSTKDVYVLRQAKEISMAMDNFNPDMVNHVCILDPTTDELKAQL